MDTSVLRSRELRLMLPHFGESTALKLGLIALRRAQTDGQPVTVDIRTPDRILFRAALPGTAALNDRWIDRKAAAAFAFGMSSLRVRQTLREKGESLATHGLAEAGHAARGGAVPIRVRGVGIVAMITIAGLPEDEDHSFAEMALKTLLSDMTTRPATRQG